MQLNDILWEVLGPQFKKDVIVLERIQKTPGLSSLEKRRLRKDLIVLSSFLRRGGGSFPACSVLVPPPLCLSHSLQDDHGCLL